MPSVPENARQERAGAEAPGGAVVRMRLEGAGRYRLLPGEDAPTVALVC